MVATSIWPWAGFVGVVLILLALDLGVIHRRPREIRPAEAALATAGWVLLALMFAAGLLAFKGRAASLTFVTGYVLEESLSIDNIFLMVLIFTFFSVPKPLQYRVLFYGVVGALVMRAVFIGAGVVLIHRFAWIIPLFGAFLVYAGIRMLFKGREGVDVERNPVVVFVRRFVPLTERLEGDRFVVTRGGRWMGTPLLLVLVVVEVTDLVFAADSIPAVFGITRDPFLVFTSNIAAVLGLRSLYFLLAAVIDRFYLLRYGLAAILAFVGATMLGESRVQVPTAVTLAVIVAILSASVAGSLLRPRVDAASRPGPPPTSGPPHRQ